MRTKKCSNRTCLRLGEALSLSEFNECKNSKDGHGNWCRECLKKYYKDNSKKMKARTKKWCKKNPDKVEKWLEENPDHKKKWCEEHPSRGKEWREKNPNYYKEWCGKNPGYVSPGRIENPDYINNWMKNKRKADSNFNMLCILRSRLNNALKGASKADTTLNLLGCAIDDFWKYLEENFIEGMTRENYGKGSGKWNVDHVIACARFDLIDPEQQKKCFHYTNLQPLWWIDNLKKGVK